MLPNSDPLPDGVYTAILTPMRPDLSPDPAALTDHARWLMSQGCTGLVLLGTTGEANSFSVAERMGILDALLDGGFPPDRLMVGTGCCALTDTVALTQHAVRNGVGGVLLLPPFYYKKVSDEGLFAGFDAVIRRVGAEGLRAYLYHIPPVSSVPISLALLERLVATYPGVFVGIKDSGGDWEHIRSLCEAFPSLRIFPGSEEFLLDALASGAAGCISATANVTCTYAAALYQARNEPDAAARQKHLTALRRAITRYPPIPALKALLRRRTGHPDWGSPRPPLTPLPPSDTDALVEQLDKLGLSFPASAGVT
jgi:4-hydroxy-tetrahydrodipicolinate synthase